jgi:hypothetical protein
MSAAIVIDVLLLAYFLSRQIRVRRVPRLPRLQVPVLLGLIGLIELVDYTGGHHVTSTDYAWFFGTLVVGAIVLGAVRALTVKIWVAEHWGVVRQGTWVTIGLWLVSIAVHFISDVKGGHIAANLEAQSLLLYIGVTYGVQNYVVHRRAMPLWDSLGPEAGQRLRVNFGSGPGGAGAFFSTFRSDQGFGPGPGAGYPPPAPARRYDPTIIDAEVVEDDEGPAELH